MLAALKDYCFEQVLELLVESGSSSALDRGISAIESASPGRAARAARIVLAHEPLQWPVVIERMQHDRPFAESFASLMDDDRSQSLVSLGEQSAAELFLVLFGPSQADPGAWYARARLSLEGWSAALLHREAGVRALAVDRLGEHLDHEAVQRVLLRAVSDEETDFGNAPPSVRAGLLWRTIPRGPHTVGAVQHLRRLVTSAGQLAAGAAAVALRPGEAPARDLTHALMSLSQACPVPRFIVEALRSSDEGRCAVDEIWPGWATRVTEEITRVRYGALDAEAPFPPPSGVVRNRVVRAFGPRLGELDAATSSVIQARVSMAAATELIATGHLEGALQQSPDDIPLDAQHALGALLMGSQQARAQVLALWPRPEGRLYPGIALEPLIEAGDLEATRVYAEWLPHSPYHWGLWLRAPLAGVLRNPLILPVARRLVTEVIERVHVPNAEGLRLAKSAAAVVLWNLSAAWHDDPAMVAQVWSIADASQTEGLRGLLIATEGVELDSKHLEDLHRRVHASLEAACPDHDGEVDYLRMLRAEREVMWIEERGFVQQSREVLCVLAGLRAPVGWCASAVLWPVLAERERVLASQRVARDSVASDFGELPARHLERFVRVAPESWCNAIVRTLEEHGALEGAIGIQALKLLPRSLQRRIVRALQGLQLAALEIPWRSTGEGGHYARDADTVRRLLFEIGDDLSASSGST